MQPQGFLRLGARLTVREVSKCRAALLVHSYVAELSEVANATIHGFDGKQLAFEICQGLRLLV